MPRIIICTGSRPEIPPIDGLTDVPYLTNKNLFDLDLLPEHFLVLGAGTVGLEMAQAFRRLGSMVTVIELEPALLPKEDEDIAACALTILEREGITFLLDSRV